MQNPDNPIFRETPEQFLSVLYPSFYSELSSRGFQIRDYNYGTFGPLVVARNGEPIYCGDGREENNSRRVASRSLKMFGGIFMPALFSAEQKTITDRSINHALYYGNRNGLTLGAHDILVDDWGKVHCGMAKLIAQGSLGYRFSEDLNPMDVVSALGRERVVELEGSHVEVGWIFNIKPGVTRVPDGRLFSTDEQALRLALGEGNVDKAAALSAQVVDLLKPDAKVLYLAR